MWKTYKLLIKDLTFIDDRFSLAEICEGGEVFDAILFGQSFIVDLDEIYSEVVGVVVNLLQLGQHLVAC